MIIHTMPQGSTEWHKIRERKVTGTSLSKVMGSKWMEYADVIVSERLTGKRKEPTFKSAAMENGTAIEPFARAAYAEAMNCPVYMVGFVQSEMFPDFGMSPDGIIASGTTPIGIAEIKCPEPQTHVKYIRNGKIPTEYDDQILSAFVVGDEIQFVDFVSFCPIVRPYPFFVKRANRADYEPKIAEARGALIKFFEHVNALESKIINSNGFIPSNLEDAIWEMTDPIDTMTDGENI